jgi:hypothetical protein
MWTFRREHFSPDFEGPFRSSSELSKSSAVKKIKYNKIYDIHLYHSYLSAFFVSAGVPNGEFPEILIAKCRSRFYCTWFFSRRKILKVHWRNGKNSYKSLCKQESDNLWCRGKLLISIKRAMNSSRIELLWLVWACFYCLLMLSPFVCFSIEPTASHFNIYYLHFCLISSVSYDEWRIKTVFIIYS